MSKSKRAYVHVIAGLLVVIIIILILILLKMIF